MTHPDPMQPGVSGSLDLGLALPDATLVAFAFLVAVTPGPSNLVLLAIGARDRVAHGLPVLVGMALGYAALWVGCMGLLGRLATLDPTLLRVAQLTGAAIMIWFVWRIVRSTRAVPCFGASDRGDQSGYPNGILGGALFSASNPKAWTTAWAATAIDAGGTAGSGALAAPTLILGATVFTAVMLGCGAWLVAGGLGSGWLRGPVATRALNAMLIATIGLSVLPVVLA